ncbi:hypothetical protein L596_015382 [Steinernema carpocapsae]|uniref:Uncharacterized protein n=1 Tax=Steinernema carpocapsae TaxID=34508 RepID=A0A4V6A332_STECR|nr:hypothetical protein L596_015382 [Steinernema carpocapsae]
MRCKILTVVAFAIFHVLCRADSVKKTLVNVSPQTIISLLPMIVLIGSVILCLFTISAWMKYPRKRRTTEVQESSERSSSFHVLSSTSVQVKTPRYSQCCNPESESKIFLKSFSPVSVLHPPPLHSCSDGCLVEAAKDNKSLEKRPAKVQETIAKPQANPQVKGRKPQKKQSKAKNCGAPLQQKPLDKTQSWEDEEPVVKKPTESAKKSHEPLREDPTQSNSDVAKDETSERKKDEKKPSDLNSERRRARLKKARETKLIECEQSKRAQIPANALIIYAGEQFMVDEEDVDDEAVSKSKTAKKSKSKKNTGKGSYSQEDVTQEADVEIDALSEEPENLFADLHK